jgi:hypothetical protein
VLAAVGLTVADMFPDRTHATPGERFALNARDVLRGIEFDLVVIVQCARCIRRGDVLDAVAWSRFDLAVERVFAAVDSQRGRAMNGKKGHSEQFVKLPHRVIDGPSSCY